jgi:nitrogen regulatory protein P-II 2
MKLITAVIKPFKLDEVRQALSAIGVHAITAIEAKEIGRRKARSDHDRGDEYLVESLPKVKIEVAVKSDLVEQVIEAIEKSAHTGTPGDGRIFVFDLEHSVRIHFAASLTS